MSHENGEEGHLDHKEISIETLSSPPLQIEPAPILQRLVATFVDSVVIGLLVTLPLGIPRPPSFLSLWSAASFLVVGFGYYFLLEGVFAATVGKFLLKLRVLDTDGDPCSWLASFKRNVLRFVDWLPFLYLLGVVLVLSSRERQRLGDRVASTIVTRVPKKDVNPPPAPFLFH